jgi:hypothetical protein
MPLKPLRNLIDPRDGTVYAGRGDVLPDDDPVAAKFPNLVCRVNDPVSQEFVAPAPVQAPKLVPAPPPTVPDERIDEDDEEPDLFDGDPDDEGVTV